MHKGKGSVLGLDDLFDIKGRIAIVTGGGGDLCGSMCLALGARGAKVALLDLKLDKAEAVAETIRKAGGEARAIACSVLDENAMEEHRAAIQRLWGAPDILINGAGGNDPRGSTTVEFIQKSEPANPDLKGFFDLDPDGFWKTFELNFQGTVLPTKVFSRGMVEKGKGAILNISSMCALTPLTKVVAYSAAKAAVANFTQWLAVHFSRTGVRVNALAPGFFMTEQLRYLHIDQKTGQYTPRAQKVIAHTPLQRYGEPGDLWGTMIWLVSDASLFVTGIVVPVDGGFSAYSI
jgi:NAD(P)-dependent dehydrogenase (short-subunit alcohol dehydrogenase family)